MCYLRKRREGEEVAQLLERIGLREQAMGGRVQEGLESLLALEQVDASEEASLGRQRWELEACLHLA